MKSSEKRKHRVAVVQAIEHFRCLYGGVFPQLICDNCGKRSNDRACQHCGCWIREGSKDDTPRETS